MAKNDPYVQPPYMSGEDNDRPRGMREVPDQASIRQQFERLDKLLAQNDDAIQRLRHVAAPMMAPELEVIERAGLDSDMAKDGIRASEFTNLVWDFANRLDDQISRLQSITNRLEV